MTNFKIKTNGIELKVNEYGDHGKPIIFLHCSRGNLALWNGVIPYFKDNFKVITLDLRGHGHSDKPEKSYSLDDMANDVKGVMDFMNIDKAYVVGSSLGGEVGVALSANYPKRVKGLICEGAIRNFFGPNGFFDIPKENRPKQKDEVRNQLSGWDFPVYDSREAMLEAEKQDYEKQGRVWNDLRKALVEYEIKVTENEEYTYNCPKRVLAAFTEEKFDVKFEDYFEKIECPVLFLPSEDEAKSHEVMDAIKGYRALLDESDIKIIEGSIHAETMLDYPEEFSKTILKFLK